MRFAEYIAAIAVAALGAATIFLARELPYRAEYGVGPGFLPLWLGVTLVVLAAMLFWSTWSRDRRADGPAEAPASPSGATPLIPAGEARTPWLIFLASTVGVVLLFPSLGLLLSMGLFMLITVRWVAHRSWRASLVYAVVSPIAFYIGFGVLLAVPLPQGPLGF